MPCGNKIILIGFPEEYVFSLKDGNDQFVSLGLCRVYASTGGRQLKDSRHSSVDRLTEDIKGGWSGLGEHS